MTPFVDALSTLLGRYASALRIAWQQRRELEIDPRLALERAFLPAHLELAETPVHPLPMWTMRIIVGLTVLVALIAALGRLDIVAIAPGKLIPKQQVKTIQPALTGVVRRILVRDGQHVQAGQRLMELDTVQAAADAGKAQLTRVDAALTAERSRALLLAQTQASRPVVRAVDDVSDAHLSEVQRLAEGIYIEYSDKLNSERAALMQREAELGTTRQQIARLEATAPLAREQADNLQSLVAEKYVSRAEYLDKEQMAQGLEHELATQRVRAREWIAAIERQRAELAALQSQFRRQQLDTLDRAIQQLAQSKHEELKAETRQKLLTLTAPVAGTVQKLKIHTLGGVAPAASPVMDIVPDDTLEIEAHLDNKDIGFVKPGQRVAVKVEAFPYTRYGLLQGTVATVSNDAMTDRRRGLTFPVRIGLAENCIRVKDRCVTLTSGMAVTAEIMTGKRSVARYFLDPVIQTGQESLRER